MRKTLSLILSIVMIVSMLSVGVFAAEGTAINSAEEFKNMAPDGIYYLAADITIDETYETDFTGTLDGNGKTVTISVPMFKQMNGTVKNLTIAGKIDIVAGETVNTAAVACQAKMARFENITNKADITVRANDDSKTGSLVGRVNGSGSDSAPSYFIGCTNEGTIDSNGFVGGIVGCCYGLDSTFENCVNKGAITSQSAVDQACAGGIAGYNGSGAIKVKNCYNAAAITAAHRAGGIIGDARKSATIEFCTNDGNITLSNTAKSAKEDACAGGIVGSSYDTSTIVPLTIKNCVNNGDITAFIEGKATAEAGGILGYLAKGTKSGNDGNTLYIDYCINNGKITAGYEAGGLVGYVFGSKQEYAHITNSINNGDVAAACWASEFIGYTNNNDTTIKNVIGAGKLSALTVADKTCYLAILGMSSADIALYTMENIFLADGGTTTILSYATAEANVANRIPLSAALGKNLSGAVIDFEGNQRTIGDSNVKAITRGELNSTMIYQANSGAGSTLFALEGGKAVFAGAKVGYTAPTTPVEPPVTDPVDTKPAVTDPVTPGTDPLDTKPADTDPVDTKPAVTEPVTPPTGDNAYVVVIALAVVAIAGTACFFVRKKVND